MASSSVVLQPRDIEILRHVARHRLTLRPVLRKLFFEGARNPGNVLKRLRQVYLETHEGLPGGVHYYTLTPKARQYLGLQGQELHAQSMQTALGVLWFCCMHKSPRPLLSKTQLATLFGQDYPKGPHAVVRNSADSCIFSIYVPGPDTSIKSVLRRLNELLDQARKHSEISAWLKTRAYGFAVLIDTQGRRQALRAALQRTQLNTRTRILLGFAPTFRTLHEVLDGRAR